MIHSARTRPDNVLSPSTAKGGAAILIATVVLCVALVDASPFGAAAPASADAGLPGTFTISASSPRIASGDRAYISVQRSGGTDGAVSVRVDSAELPAELATVIAPIGTDVTFLDGDAQVKTIPIVFLSDESPGGLPGVSDVPGTSDVPGASDVPGVSDVPGTGDVRGTGHPHQNNGFGDGAVDLPGRGGGSAHAATSRVAASAVARAIAAEEGGSALLTVSLSAPGGGASLGTPSSVSISVATPPTTTPVEGGSGTTGSTVGGTTPGAASKNTAGTTTPGAASKNSAGTTTPVRGGPRLADTGVEALLPFLVATSAALAGLAALLFARRRRASESS